MDSRRIGWVCWCRYRMDVRTMNDGHTPFCDMQGHGPMCGPCDHHCRGCVYQAERADAAVAELDELRTSCASRERAAAEAAWDEACTRATMLLPIAADDGMVHRGAVRDEIRRTRTENPYRQEDRNG